MKTTKKKRRKRSKVKVILTVVVGIFIVLAVASYIRLPSNTGAKTAQEYFQILGSTVDVGDFPNWPDTKEVLLKAISFNITAVGGDAHGVVIDSIALSQPKPLGDILKGQIVFVTLEFGGGYLSTLKDQGYPVKIRIRSMEAAGELTFYILFE